MKQLDYVPYGLDAIIQHFGDPAKPDFMTKQCVAIDLPYMMVGYWKGRPTIRRLVVHKFVAASLYDALQEIGDYMGVDYLKTHELNFLGDVLAYRAKKGRKDLSTHSWGIAIDINPNKAPWDKPSRQPQVIVDAFVKRGWVWGGTWKPTDGMHFQAADGY